MDARLMHRGKIIALRQTPEGLGFTLQTAAKTQDFSYSPAPSEALSEPIQVGDWVEVESNGQGDVQKFRRLTATLRPGSKKFTERVCDPKRIHALRIRSEVEKGIRDFFEKQGFLETRTPLLVRSPGMEIHIRPFKLETGAFLPTSPEFAMKRLLAGGLEKIFQIAPAFRYEPNSTTHHPEFTLLEWYRAYADLAAIQSDTESLVEFLAQKLFRESALTFQGQRIDVRTPWPRLKIRDLFNEIGVDLVANPTAEALANHCHRLGLSTRSEDTWDDLFFRIWMNQIEPHLPKDRAVFVERYPPSQAALAVLDRDPDGSIWAKRFEFYIGGLELGNAFEELTDAREQRTRFVRDMEERTKIYGRHFPPSPIDEDFLWALEEGMPPSGGIAVGVDRLVMLFADEAEIDRTIWLPSYPGDSLVEPLS